MINEIKIKANSFITLANGNNGFTFDYSAYPILKVEEVGDVWMMMSFCRKVDIVNKCSGIVAGIYARGYSPTTSQTDLFLDSRPSSTAAGSAGSWFEFGRIDWKKDFKFHENTNLAIYIVGSSCLEPQTDFWETEIGTDKTPYITIRYTFKKIITKLNELSDITKNQSLNISWSSNATQKGFELKYTNNGIEKTVTGTTANAYSFDNFAFEAGALNIKVRTFNGYVWSEWDSKTITISDHPITLTLTPNNLTLDQDKVVEAKWTTTDPQTKYEFEYTSIKGGTKLITGTTAKSHTFPVGSFYFETVSMRVRTFNGYIWSDWKSATFKTTGIDYPTTIKPSGTSESRDEDITVSWVAPYQTNYELKYISNGITTTKAGTTQKSYTIPQNTIYQGNVEIQLRINNGVTWTPWKTVNFIAIGIDYPNNLEPNSIAQNKDTDTELSWVAKYQTSFELEYTSDGVTKKVTGTTGKKITIPANTLATGRVNWKLRIHTGLYLTDWAEASFTAFGTPETPTLTTVAQYETATPTFTWTSSGQVSYRIQVLKDAVVVLDSSDVYSNAKQHVFQTSLENNTDYTVIVRINNQYEYSSAWSTKAFKVVFTDLQKPTFDMFPDDREGKVLFNIYNAKGQSEFNYCELLRREYGSIEWEKVATNLGETSIYTDYTCRSGVLYEYKVSAIKTTGGYTDSEIALKTVNLRNTMLSDTGNYDNYVLLTHNPKKSRSLKKETHIMQYNGSPTPRVEFGDIVYQGVSVNFTVDKATLDKLSDLYYSNNTLLLRDNRGKKLFGVISGEIAVEDVDFMNYNISFNFIETIFKEGVPA